MTRARTVVGQATDALYDAYAVFHDAMLQAGTGVPANLRQNVMGAVRTLATYIAYADTQLSPQEITALGEIFWLDGGAGDIGCGDEAASSPDLIDGAVDLLGSCAGTLPGPGCPADTYGAEDFLVALQLVFHTVLAADHGNRIEAEAARLTDIMARLASKLVAEAPTATPTPTPGTSKPEGTPAASTADGIASVLKQLDALVGLGAVKQQVTTLTNVARVFAIRRSMGLPVPDMSFHLVFLGNPGTGKTTVARIIAQLYGKLGLLSKGHLVEVDRSGLVAGYVGQTAAKVQAVVTSALGGVLFIDEAYALDEGGGGDFGQEAVATLLKAMEDHRDDLVVIAAGYTDRMQGFMSMNPGLRSRMPHDLAFADYTPADMVSIFHGMAAAAHYTLPDDADALLTPLFQKLWDERQANFANARDVRNVFERVVNAQANRLGSVAEPDEADLCTLTGADLMGAD